MGKGLLPTGAPFKLGLVTHSYLVMLIEKQRTPLQERQASKVAEITPAAKEETP